jgi:hypothetical protein
MLKAIFRIVHKFVITAGNDPRRSRRCRAPAMLRRPPTMECRIGDSDTPTPRTVSRIAREPIGDIDRRVA